MATCSCSMNGSGDWHAAADRARCSSRAAATRRSKQEVVQPRITFVGQSMQRAGARRGGLTTYAADSYRTETKVSCVAIPSSQVASAGKLRCACNCEDQRTRRAPWVSGARSSSRTLPRFAVPHRTQPPEIERRVALDRSHTPDDAIAPHPRFRTSRRPARRIAQYTAQDRNNQSSVMPSAANCNRGSDRVHQPGGFIHVIQRVEDEAKSQDRPQARWRRSRRRHAVTRFAGFRRSPRARAANTIFTALRTACPTRQRRHGVRRVDRSGIGCE
jgi:hypothetical protein